MFGGSALQTVNRKVRATDLDKARGCYVGYEVLIGPGPWV